MRRVTLLGLLLMVVLAVGGAQSQSSSAADEVIAATKAQWTAEMRKDIEGSQKMVADDYTEFNDDYPTRLDSKQINRNLAEATASGAGSVIASPLCTAPGYPPAGQLLTNSTPSKPVRDAKSRISQIG